MAAQLIGMLAGKEVRSWPAASTWQSLAPISFSPTIERAVSSVSVSALLR